MNNLYGCAQLFKLPAKNFVLIDEQEKSGINWATIDPNDARGYIVEVDLLYPENIHDSTSSFPLCPENLDIYYEMLSPYQKKCLKNLHSREGYKSRKLTATFLPKTKIVLHGLHLSLYLELGMKLVKVHRCIRFDQSDYLRTWVNFCTARRSQSKDTFSKKFWKSMVNIVFGT